MSSTLCKVILPRHGDVDRDGRKSREALNTRTCDSSNLGRAVICGCMGVSAQTSVLSLDVIYTIHVHGVDRHVDARPGLLRTYAPSSNREHEQSQCPGDRPRGIGATSSQEAGCRGLRGRGRAGSTRGRAFKACPPALHVEEGPRTPLATIKCAQFGRIQWIAVKSAGVCRCWGSSARRGAQCPQSAAALQTGLKLRAILGREGK